MKEPTPPRQLVFEPTPEIFATDAAGGFSFPLLAEGRAYVETAAYDEVRFVVSLWHPSGQKSIDLDRAYVELQGTFDPDDEHWTKIAEIEPVVPAYSGADSFDGWIVLPILGTGAAFALVGSGFEPRSRLQIRAHAYFVA
jgi:hypothetical protein